MNKSKVYLILVIIITIAFATKASASLTFTTNSITGTVASTIDVGSGNALSLQTTNNGNIITGTGKLGLGISSPTYILSLLGTAAQTIWMERNTTAATAGQGLTLDAGGAVSGGTNLAGGDLTLKSGISTGTGTSSIHFYAATAGGSGTADNTPTEKMTILGSGNVGIGETNPSQKLEVAGNIEIAQNSTSKLHFTGTGDNYVYFNPGNSIYIYNYTGDDPDSLNIEMGNNGNIILYPGTGYVGVGNQSPSQKLDVDGGIQLDTNTAKPTCDSTVRGTFWVVKSGAGVKDTVEVCAKDAGDAYAWRTIY